MDVAWLNPGTKAVAPPTIVGVSLSGVAALPLLRTLPTDTLLTDIIGCWPGWGGLVGPLGAGPSPRGAGAGAGQELMEVGTVRSMGKDCECCSVGALGCPGW